MRIGYPSDPDEYGDEDVAHAVECGVAAKTGWKRLLSVETQGYRGDRRREDAAEDSHDDVRDKHDGKVRHPHDREAATRQDEGAGDDQGPLCPSVVDEGADRWVRYDADEATGREHGADRGLAPLCLCEQVNVHIDAEPASHIGEEEIDPVQSIQPHARDQSISRHLLHALKGESNTTGDRGAWRCRTYRRARCARQARRDCHGGSSLSRADGFVSSATVSGQSSLPRLLSPGPAHAFAGEFDAVGGFIS